jgi:putative chitinase
MGNGPEGSGDGYRYRARGPLGITGRDNYERMSDLLGADLIADPDQLTVPLWGTFAAAAWWDTHGCNQAADDDDFEGVTRIIQLGNRHSTGRINGMPERLAMLSEVQEAMR